MDYRIKCTADFYMNVTAKFTKFRMVQTFGLLDLPGSIKGRALLQLGTGPIKRRRLVDRGS